MTCETTADDCELRFTRRFDAPRALVFRAWTDAALFARWWGPHEFTTPVCQWNARPGAAWRIVMRGPDGAQNPIRGDFLEVVPDERLVLTMDCSECPPEWQAALNGARREPDPGRSLQIHVTVTFAERGGGTELTILSRFDSVDDRDANLKLGAADGWAQSLDRLETVVATQGATGVASPRASQAPGRTELTRTDREVIVTRVVNAPRALVFKVWTDPEHVGKWWGPDGFRTTTHQMDVQPGGTWRFVMHGPDGTDYQNRIVFEEVRAPERLVYDHVSGPNFHVTVTFEAQGPKQTRVTMRSAFATAAELKRTIESFGMLEGAKQHIGRLAEYLATL